MTCSQENNVEPGICVPCGANGQRCCRLFGRDTGPATCVAPLRCDFDRCTDLPAAPGTE